MGASVEGLGEYVNKSCDEWFSVPESRCVSTNVGSSWNGMKFRGKLSVYQGGMDGGRPEDLLYAMACNDNPGKRENDGRQCHRRAEPIPNRVGDPVAPRSDHRCGRGGRLSLLARPWTHARHHHPALSVTDAAWPHRVHPSAPPLRHTLQCLS